MLLAMLVPTFASCVSDIPSESVATSESESVTEKESEIESDPDEEESKMVLSGAYGDSILHAAALANKVQAYYTDPDRLSYRIENANMSLDYALDLTGKQQVTALKSVSGKTYVENTMDVFVEMTDGKRYYASDSSKSTRANLFKYGYYYYDLHLLEQNFSGKVNITESESVRMSLFNTASAGAGGLRIDGEGVISFTVADGDPSVSAPRLSYDADTYNAISLELCSTNATKAKIYFVAGGNSGHTSQQSVAFDIRNDGEFHTYTVILSGAEGYTGRVSNIRIDIDNAALGDDIKLRNVSLSAVDSNAPALLLDRQLHTYSDKLNQVLHFVATEDVSGIVSLGIVTDIKEDRVKSFVVKDREGLKYSLEEVAWESAEYAGFLIDGVGVFGIILVDHENSGRLTVTCEDGYFKVIQSSTPEGGMISKPEGSTANDYYMGQRVYTDECDSLDLFIAEAELERAPTSKISSDKYLGYDALRGAYRF